MCPVAVVDGVGGLCGDVHADAVCGYAVLNLAREPVVAPLFLFVVDVALHPALVPAVEAVVQLQGHFAVRLEEEDRYCELKFVLLLKKKFPISTF